MRIGPYTEVLPIIVIVIVHLFGGKMADYWPGKSVILLIAFNVKKKKHLRVI